MLRRVESHGPWIQHSEQNSGKARMLEQAREVAAFVQTIFPSQGNRTSPQLWHNWLLLLTEMPTSAPQPACL